MSPRSVLSGFDTQELAFRAALSSIRLGILALRIQLEMKAGFDADQPRDDQGRWTDGGGGVDFGERLQPVADWGGYPVDLTEEEALGGHTIDRHVGKPDSYLKARLQNDRINIPWLGVTAGSRRAGSFSSLEAANKLVNSTIAQNQSILDRFVAGSAFTLSQQYLFATFDSITGKEAFAPNERTSPVIRPTYGVTVRLRRSTTTPKGYVVESAWPMNED